MSNCMVCCKNCQCNTVGIKTGLSAGGHLVNIFLVFLTGLLWCPVYLLVACTAGSTRCTVCGNTAKKL